MSLEEVEKTRQEGMSQISSGGTHPMITGFENGGGDRKKCRKLQKLKMSPI